MLPVRKLGYDRIEPRKLRIEREHGLLRGLCAGLVVRQETLGHAQAHQLEIAWFRSQALGHELRGFVQVVVAQADADQDGVSGAEPRIHAQGQAREPLRLVEVERLRELHARQAHQGFGLLGRFAEHLVQYLFGVARVVLLEEQIGTK